MHSPSRQEKIGQWLLTWRRGGIPGKLFSEIADHIPWERFEEKHKHTSMQVEATEVYQSELRERTAQGDKYARAVLEEGGWNEPIEQ